MDGRGGYFAIAVPSIFCATIDSALLWKKRCDRVGNEIAGGEKTIADKGREEDKVDRVSAKTVIRIDFCW